MKQKAFLNHLFFIQYKKSTCFCFLFGDSEVHKDSGGSFVLLEVDIVCTLSCFPILDFVASLPRTGVYLSLPAVL